MSVASKNNSICNKMGETGLHIQATIPERTTATLVMPPVMVTAENQPHTQELNPGRHIFSIPFISGQSDA